MAKFAGKFPTNLKAHLKKRHTRVYQELLGKEEKKERVKRQASAARVTAQPTIVETFVRSKLYECTSTKSQNITRKLSIFVSAGNVAN